MADNRILTAIARASSTGTPSNGRLPQQPPRQSAQLMRPEDLPARDFAGTIQRGDFTNAEMPLDSGSIGRTIPKGVMALSKAGQGIIDGMVDFANKGRWQSHRLNFDQVASLSSSDRAIIPQIVESSFGREAAATASKSIDDAVFFLTREAKRSAKKGGVTKISPPEEGVAPVEDILEKLGIKPQSPRERFTEL